MDTQPAKLSTLKNGDRFRFIGEDQVYVVHDAGDGEGAVHITPEGRTGLLALQTMRVGPDESVQVVGK